jgi:hypothetical protein
MAARTDFVGILQVFQQLLLDCEPDTLLSPSMEMSPATPATATAHLDRKIFPRDAVQDRRYANQSFAVVNEFATRIAKSAAVGGRQ